MRHIFRHLITLVVMAFPFPVLAQDKTAKPAAADSTGAIKKAFLDFKSHAPQIDWYLIFVDMLWILLIMLMAYLIARYFLQPLRVIAVRKKRHATILTRSVFIIQIIVWLMALYMILFKVIRVSPITEAIIGATIGIALLVASRDILANLLSGIRIAMTKIPKAGDRITLDGMQGVIEQTGLITTMIRREENLTGLVPNRLFLQRPVSEMLAADTNAPVQVVFFFPADGDFVRIRELAERAASLSKYIYLNYPIRVDLENVYREGKSLVHLRVGAQVLDPAYESAFRSEITEQVLGEIFHQKLFSREQLNF